MKLWKVDEYLFQVVSTPITTNSQLLGTLTLGMALTDYEAKQLKAEVSTDVHFIMDDKVVASTLSGTEREKLPLFLDLFDKANEDQFQLIDLDGEEYFISLSPLGNEEGCWLMCSVHKSQAMELIFQIRDKMWIIGLAVFIIAMLIAWMIGNNISRPILKMVNTLGEVQKGNLDTTIELTGGLEFKKLSGAFNEMVAGLRERLRLEKYVGDHTRAQVKMEDGGSPFSLEACVMFSDIRGFTAFSSGLDPETVIQLLNEWLGFQTKIVHKCGGIVDKFVGDEVMAIFRGDDCIEKGVACAREIQDQVPHFMGEYLEHVALGIGLNYGSMVMGNIGASERMDYTVIGSVVNLSARLCSAAKGGEILLPLDVYKKIDPDASDFSIFEMEFKGVGKTTQVINVANEQ
jgi:adenylate cyclase